jgi:DNA-binding NarL/FixJ family response regulator
MIRAAVVAGTGTAMADLTLRLGTMRDLEISLHASGRTPIGLLLRRAAPDVVLIDERGSVARALVRVAEARLAAPAAPAIVLSPFRARWSCDALDAGVAVTLPLDPEPALLELAIRGALHDRVAVAVAA